MNTRAESASHRTCPPLSAWWRAARFHYVPPSYLPAMVGAVASWTITGSFQFLPFLIVVVCVTFNHVALNMTDDYFDYVHSVDRAESTAENPYTGGSGTLTSSLIKPEQMRSAFLLLYALTVLGGFSLVLMRGWPVLVFGVVGVLSSFFYTAPPVRYAYRGLGEVSQLINFSATIGLGSYYVQAGQLSWETLIMVLPLGFMMLAMITINEIPDEDSDRGGGKRNLVVLLGARRAALLYGGSMAASYLILIVPPLAGLGSFWYWLPLITLPWFSKALSVLVRHYRNPVLLAPANLLTIRIHNLTGILLFAGAVVRGSVEGRSFSQMLVPIAVLIVFYTPVALTVFFNLLSVEKRRRKPRRQKEPF